MENSTQSRFRVNMALSRYIELETKSNFGIIISKKRNMMVAERFLSNVIKEYGDHAVSTDGGTWYPPQACRFLKINHHLHILLMRKVSLKGLFSISRIERKALTIIFSVKRRNAN